MYLFDGKLKDIYGLHSKRKVANDAVGVEIEMELRTPPSTSAHFLQTVGELQDTFDVKTDGSLRHFGIEFVSKPISIKDKDKMLGHWDAIVSSPLLKDRIEDCPRASVHVHVNVMDKTYDQLMSILLAYTLLEGPMVAYCGKYRMGNLFALRIPEADGVFNNLTRTIPNFTRHQFNTEHRYSALNLASIPKFGTVEFRSLGSVYDPERIDTWVTGVQKLVTVASSFKNAPDVYNFYTNSSKEDFLVRFLGEKLSSGILRRVSNIDDLMEDGEEFAISLLSSSVDDWTHEKDFRRDLDFLEYAKTQMGYSPYTILGLSKNMYQNIKREMGTSSVSLREISDFTDEEAEEALNPVSTGVSLEDTFGNPAARE